MKTAIGPDYIWVNRWDEFQTFQTKRGKPWAPPWIKVYPALLDDPDYLDLPPETRCLLEGLWKLFASSRLTIPKDTRYLSRKLHQRVMTRQLERLNHAGWISFCSGTVLEQRRNAFWNSSVLEVDKTKTEKKSSSTSSKSSPIQEARPQGRITNGDAPSTLVFDETAFMGRVDEMKQRKIDEPYFERLLKAVGDTEENFAKLRRASRGKPPAALVNALEAAQAPTTRDRLAVALTVLADYVAA